MPSACSYDDAETIIKDGVKLYNSTGIRITVDVSEDNCYVRHRIDYLKLLKENIEIMITM